MREYGDKKQYKEVRDGLGDGRTLLELVYRRYPYPTMLYLISFGDFC